MMKCLILFIFYSTIYPISGLELAEKMEDRLKPIDLRSENTMVLTNKKGREKNIIPIQNSTKQNSNHY